MTSATAVLADESRNGNHLRAVPPVAPTIFQALANVMAGVRAVGKDSRNTDQNYLFRGIDAVVNAVGPKLREYGVIVVPEVLDAAYRDVTTNRGKPSREVTVKVRYRFYGPTGDFIDATTVGEAMDFGDKGTAKAMSVAFRVALLQALCLPTDEPDADSQSYERAYRDETSNSAPSEFERPKPSGPSAEQTAAYDEAAKRIAGSESSDGLKAVWLQVLADNKSGVIHDSHGPSLIAARDERFAELSAEA